MTVLKKILLVVSLLLILALVCFGLYKYTYLFKSPPVIIPSDVRNVNYVIDQETYTLKDGLASKPITTDSVTQKTVRIFGTPVYGDLNGDGDPYDAAVTLVSNPGGTGTLYYAVLAIKTNALYQSTNAILLGDRIAPQTVEIHDGRAVYNYAERKTGEPMTTSPSLGKSLWIHYASTTNTIGEFIKDFEGESNPDTMTLGMKEWYWIQSETFDNGIISPRKKETFSITFNKDASLNVKTDCTTIPGSYKETSLKKINIVTSTTTPLYCKESQTQFFSTILADVEKYTFTSRGELILYLQKNSGTITFR